MLLLWNMLTTGHCAQQSGYEKIWYLVWSQADDDEAWGQKQHLH
jgi:hypothetical protein